MFVQLLCAYRVVSLVGRHPDITFCGWLGVKHQEVVGWLVGWLVDWLTDWFIDWLIDWLIDCIFLISLNLIFTLLICYVQIDETLGVTVKYLLRNEQRILLFAVWRHWPAKLWNGGSNTSSPNFDPIPNIIGEGVLATAFRYMSFIKQNWRNMSTGLQPQGHGIDINSPLQQYELPEIGSSSKDHPKRELGIAFGYVFHKAELITCVNRSSYRGHGTENDFSDSPSCLNLTRIPQITKRGSLGTTLDMSFITQNWLNIHYENRSSYWGHGTENDFSDSPSCLKLAPIPQVTQRRSLG